MKGLENMSAGGPRGRTGEGVKYLSGECPYAWWGDPEIELIWICGGGEGEPDRGSSRVLKRTSQRVNVVADQKIARTAET